jgi:membrane fusion protein (multidrug efflux system)
MSVQPVAPTQEAPSGRTPPPRAPALEGKPAAANRAARPSGRRWLRLGLFALLPLLLVAGLYWYVTGGATVSESDAYINAKTLGISTDVAGIVMEVDVAENQHVEAGQVLYRLDPLQLQIALDNATANLSLTALTLQAMLEDYKRMLDDAAAQEAQVALDQTSYQRAQLLLTRDAVAQATYDQAQATLEVDKRKLDSLHQQAAVQLQRLGGSASAPLTQHPQYLQAKAQVDEAQRQLDHATVKAPFGGIVTSVPSTTPGRFLGASATAFYLVDTDHVWLDVNPKETEMTYVRAGQSVTVTVDAYPGVIWHGAVDSIGPAAAQQFALLPPQNTSGNWVKVVQRIPIRVQVDAGNKDQPPLRAGMSAEVSVYTGHPRGLPHLF